MQWIALEAHHPAAFGLYSNMLVPSVKPISNLNLDERRRFGEQIQSR